ncbi:MAG: AraC family transcriptional regulator [Thermodesulfobacteriota bacterium]|nr:MAG: AraC family transcriptional regulator [Thermodesulfobacteriota bacterium]
MLTQDDIFYEAILTRDYRFDGKFFAGSKSTYIYCRPICPAKPKRENVEFFDSSIEAEQAGYRPCIRCRPESAPSSPAWVGKSETVRRGLNLLLGPEFYEYDEDSFAYSLGVSSRHVRRMFKEETGKTAKQIADNNRLDFARKLITETSLPISRIAYSSGFSSIRRFNDAVKKRFARPPSALRKSKTTKYDKYSGITLELSYRPPFLWDDHLRFYNSHKIIGVENVTEGSYSRSFNKYGTSGHIRVSQVQHKPSLSVTVMAEDMKCLYPLMQHIRQMFDLNADPVVIANFLERSNSISKIVSLSPGLRLSRFWDPFEGAICTILGQLVSVDQARKVIGKLVAQYGETVTSFETGEDTKLFPTAEILSQAKIENLGTTKVRAEAINKLSRMVADGSLCLDSGADYALLRRTLLSIKGIGSWTADYISLRALGEPDVFPSKDLILKRALERCPDINTEDYAPYRSYLAAYLWHQHIKHSSKKEKVE